MGEVFDQRVHERALIRRVGDDRIGVAVLLERQGVLAGRDVTSVDAPEPVRFR